MAETKIRSTQVELSDSFTFTGAVIAPTPSADNHVAIKSYVDNVAAGIDVKDAVQYSSNDNITDASGASYNSSGGSDGVGEFTGIDLTDDALFDLGGGTIEVGDRILVKDQDDATENGIYIVTTAGASGVIERSEDFNGSPTNEVSQGCFVFVQNGTTYGNTGWVISSANSSGGYHELNSDDISWTQFSGTGTFTAGNGLTLNGTAFDVNVDNSTIEINTDTLRLKDGGITNAKINASAAIVESKLSLDYATSALNTAITNAQNEIDLIETALGDLLGSGGTYQAFSGTNYIDGNSDLSEDLTDLDSQINTNAGAISSNAGNISTNAGDIDDLEAAVGSSTGTAGLNYSTNNYVADEDSLLVAIGKLDTALAGSAGDVTNVIGGLGLIDSGSGGDITIDLDLNELVAETIAINEDLIPFIDNTDGGTHKVSIANLATAMAGNGISATSGAFAVDFVREFDMEINWGADSVTLSNSPVSGSELVFRNGVLQNPGASDDYQIADQTVTFNSELESGDTVAVWYLK